MIKLYYAPDNASLIVRIVLETLNLPYKAILVDRSVNAQKSEEYLQLNPNGLIPVCVIDDVPVFETAAICLSLCDHHKQLIPSVHDAHRTQFLKWLFFLSNSLHTDLRMRFYPNQYVDEAQVSTSRVSEITDKRIQHRVSVIETAYVESDGDYLFDQGVSLIDIYLAVCLRWLQIYPVEKHGTFPMHNYPDIHNMMRQLEQIETVVAACQKEGITGSMFTRPEYSNPPEGVAL